MTEAEARQRAEELWTRLGDLKNSQQPWTEIVAAALRQAYREGVEEMRRETRSEGTWLKFGDAYPRYSEVIDDTAARILKDSV